MENVECEYCARLILRIQTIINGYEIHNSCFNSLSPEMQESETKRFMALPHKVDPERMQKFRKIEAYAMKHKLGIFGTRDMTPNDIRQALAS